MLNCLFVGIGGFAGAICRYLMGMIPLQDKSGFPWITLCINAIGAFCHRPCDGGSSKERMGRQSSGIGF